MNKNEIKMEFCKSIFHEITSLFREEKEKVLYSAEKELRFIVDSLNEKGEEISLGEYKKLVKRKEELEKEISLNNKYCDGILDARAYLCIFAENVDL